MRGSFVGLAKRLLFSCFVMSASMSGSYADSVADAFLKVLDGAGFRDIRPGSISEERDALTLDNIKAEMDGVEFQVAKIVVSGAVVEDEEFFAKNIVITEARRMTSEFIIGFDELVLSDVSFDYSGTLQALPSSVVLSNGVLMDSSMSAVSIEFANFTKDDAGGLQLSLGGNVAGGIITAFMPGVLSPVSRDVVPFSVGIGVDHVVDNKIKLISSLDVDGYGKYQLNGEFSGDAAGVSLLPLSRIKEYRSDNFQLTLSGMEWVQEFLSKHPSDEIEKYTIFMSKVLGGIIAGFGTFKDGLLVEGFVKDFLNKPSDVSIKASPDEVLDNLFSRGRNKSLNFVIERH